MDESRLPKRRIDPHTGRPLPPINTYTTLDLLVGSTLLIGAGAALITAGTYFLPKAEQFLEALSTEIMQTNYFTPPAYFTPPQETPVYTYTD